MRLPDFLIIGAMKAGTTTLWRDLVCNPCIFTPHHKEPHTLVHDDVRSARGLRKYARLFAGAAPDQVCGEASTGYSKLPTFPGIAELAREVIGPELKVIYVVREPISRIVSHHHHAVTNVSEDMPANIDEAVRKRSQLLDYTRYAWQIRPWLDAFGPNQVRIVVLEEYAKNRAGTVDSISEFLGAPPRSDLISEERIYNRGSDKPILRKGFAAALYRTRLYQRVVRPVIPLKARDFLRYTFLDSAPPRPAPPTAETKHYILEQLRPDIEELCTIMNRAKSPWRLDHEREGRQSSPDPDGRTHSIPAAT